MSTYKDSGVDIEAGDQASRLAYGHAKATFAGREGMIGSAAILEGGFSGALDMGDFFLIQNDDGVGSKVMIAEMIGDYSTLGFDLLAMVVDDAICTGAEVISVTNTVDTEKVDAKIVDAMMAGLSQACLEQKVVIPGGEIAELSSQVIGMTWNASAVGIVEKDKFIDGSKVAAGDKVIALRSHGFRSNGFSLVRHILKENFGEKWFDEDFGNGQSWGEVVLKPSLIYHRGLLGLLGAYGEKRAVDVHGLVHMTGGGFEGNFWRVVDRERFDFEFNEGLEGFDASAPLLCHAHEAMKRLMDMGQVSYEEAAKTWNMGLGMLVIVPAEEFERSLEFLDDAGFEHVLLGEIVQK